MKSAFAAIAAAALVLPASGALADTAIDWSKVPASTVQLFYPGQSTYEWLRSPGHPKGQKQVEDGRACTSCHEDDEQDIGSKVVKGDPIEPTPVKDKPGYLNLKVQAAYDDKNAYFRLQWKTQNAYPGEEHRYLQFDGSEWKPYGGSKLDKDVQDGKQPAISEDRVTLMIDDGKVPMFAKQGCWLTCHNGSPGMPNAAAAEEIASNPLLKAGNQAEVHKFLPASRTVPGDWKTGKTLEEIAKIKSEGGFADFIPWYASRSNPVGMAGDAYILEYRLADVGTDIFAENLDPATHQALFMWDEKKAGYKSIAAGELRKAQHFLIKEKNAAAFDPKAGWKAGDLLPAFVLTSASGGSAADNKAAGSWKDGEWTVVITRPLNLANGDDKALKPGSTYNIGFAVHDGDIGGRGHFVSFVRSIGFGADGKIKAVKLP